MHAAGRLTLGSRITAAGSYMRSLEYVRIKQFDPELEKLWILDHVS